MCVHQFNNALDKEFFFIEIFYYKCCTCIKVLPLKFAGRTEIPGNWERGGGGGA